MDFIYCRYVLTNHGLQELYRGIVPVLWRNGPSNAMFFMLREEASELLPQQVYKLSTNMHLYPFLLKKGEQKRWK